MAPTSTGDEEPEYVDAVPAPKARALIDALRELAQFLADHPDVPTASTRR